MEFSRESLQKIVGGAHGYKDPMGLAAFALRQMDGWAEARVIITGQAGRLNVLERELEKAWESLTEESDVRGEHERWLATEKSERAKDVEALREMTNRVDAHHSTVYGGRGGDPCRACEDDAAPGEESWAIFKRARARIAAWEQTGGRDA